MANEATPRLRSLVLSQPDHNVAPDFAWALVSGLFVLGVSALPFTLFATWGGPQLHVALPLGAAVPLAAHSRGLGGIFLSGTLVVLVARGTALQSR